MAAMRRIFRHDLFLGKVAVVTGGGTGIGKVIASDLAHLGCKVVIASRKKETLESTSQEINQLLETETEEGKQSRVYPFQCNIRNEEDVSLIA